MTKEIAILTKSDLALVENNLLETKQLKFLLSRTPKNYIKKRPAKGGGEWEFVSGGYVKKVLNLMFGWNWDFEIINQMVLHGEAIVQGRLTCRTQTGTIVKTQFGNKDVVYKKQSAEDAKLGLDRIPLSIGNDLKAAATDCLKKCAADIGIAADIYNKEDFMEVKVIDDITLDQLTEMYQNRLLNLTKEQAEDCERILDPKKPELRSFTKLYNTLIKIPVNE